MLAIGNISFTQTGLDQQGSSILQYLWTIFILVFFFISLFPPLAYRMQSFFITRDIRDKLMILEKFAFEAKSKTEKLLSDKGVKDAKQIVDSVSEFFTIEPVSIEPTDIIKRLSHVLRTGEDKVRKMIEMASPNIDSVSRSKIETALEITNALNLIYKVVRHYLILAEKLKNFYLLAQLQMVVPLIVRQAEAYAKAMDPFIKGKPVGDSIGPLIASRFLAKAERKWVVERDTIAGEVYFEGRKLIIVKAEGPSSTVGRPGIAIEKIVEENKGRVSRIITVDAALKLEGEQSGTIAEGVGAAIGDPGPEKIAIERVAANNQIPLDAIVIKMSYEEAIQEMKKEIYDAADKVVEYIKTIVKERTKEGDTIIIAGIGNSVGVAQ